MTLAARITEVPITHESGQGAWVQLLLCFCRLGEGYYSLAESHCCLTEHAHHPGIICVCTICEGGSSTLVIEVFIPITIYELVKYSLVYGAFTIEGISLSSHSCEVKQPENTYIFYCISGSRGGSLLFEEPPLFR